MTFYTTSSLGLAITLLISMTQRSRNHSMEPFLSVTATAGLCGVTREVMLLYYHPLPLLGWGRGAWTPAVEQTDILCLPSDSPATGLAQDSLCEHGATDQGREHAHCQVLSSQVDNPEGWCWVLTKPTNMTERSTWTVHLGLNPHLLFQKPPVMDMLR